MYAWKQIYACLHALWQFRVYLTFVSRIDTFPRSSSVARNAALEGNSVVDPIGRAEATFILVSASFP